MPSLAQYLALIAAAKEIGPEIAALVMHIANGHARDTLTPEELAALRAAWQSDIDRSASNAGLPSNEPGP